MGIVLPKLRESARGQICTFMLPGICNGDRSTVVLCHCRIGHYGGATKPEDWFAAWGCFACHQAIDNHRVEDEARAWLIAIKRTQLAWFEEGLMSFPETRKQTRPLSKIVARPAQFRR